MKRPGRIRSPRQWMLRSGLPMFITVMLLSLVFILCSISERMLTPTSSVSSHRRQLFSEVQPLLSESQAKEILKPGDEKTLTSVFTWLTTVLDRWCRNLQVVEGSSRQAPDQTSEEGNKRVCLNTTQLNFDPDHSPCLVYSFGIGKDSSLEEHMARLGCQVHAFEPYAEEPEILQQLGNVHFHRIGLSAANMEVRGVPLRTLDAIIDQLGHSNDIIHYLKLDAEGAEYDMFTQQLLSPEGRLVLDGVRQLAVTVHLINLGEDPKVHMYEVLARSFDVLMELGFRVVHSRASTFCKRRYLFPGVRDPMPLAFDVLAVRVAQDFWDRNERGTSQGFSRQARAAGMMFEKQDPLATRISKQSATSANLTKTSDKSYQAIKQQ